jgi:hypothetical protein
MLDYPEYVNQFMSKAYDIIHDEMSPRVFLKCNKLLQLSPDKRVGDWYIF